MVPRNSLAAGLCKQKLGVAAMSSETAGAETVKRRLSEYLTELLQTGQARWYGSVKPASVPAGKAILALSPVDQVAYVMATLELRTTLNQEHGWDTLPALEALRTALLKKSLPFDEPHIVKLAWGLAHESRHYLGPDSGILNALERYRQDHELPAEAIALLMAARLKYPGRMSTAQSRRALQRLDALLAGKAQLQLAPGEVWSDAAIAAIESATPHQREIWIRLLDHCQQATSGTPTAKWQKEADKLVDELGGDHLRRSLLEWLPLIDKPHPGDNQPFGGMMLLDLHLDFLKGLAWCAARFEDPEMARALGHAAVSAYKKLPGIGPRATKLGNACVYALGAMPGKHGLAQLALLKVRVKFGTAQKGIEKSLTAVAERLGLPRDEIEELAVPTYGLDGVGLRRETLGDFTAELTASADGSTEIAWRKADGKTQKSVPAAVKAEFADDLKELKGAAKDIEKMLPAQKDRLDNLFLADKRWPLAVWRERYLDHPLMGILARRLIWEFVAGDRAQCGIWHDDRLVDVRDEPLAVPEDANARLWHPINRPTDEVLAWRDWLERHELRQPFKQAHREVYVLTDAERHTRAYSNRFAAHIVKQHQYNALCGIRGWKNKLRLMVDDSYPPTSRDLPAWGLRAEFWVEGAGDNYGTDTNDAGTFLYLATDQVRFYRIGAPELMAHAGGGGYGRYQGPAPEPVPLDEIPPLVFSEIMRDVDLFVGVASVGNDPNWLDGGREGRFVDYWQTYSFGDLSATAKTRREVLQKIVPRLKIADRCSFEDRFLVVEGKLRTYKIHLGSANILMRPNDEYLCIVPGRGEASAGDKVFLPFEGDRTLSIILSKALLLAADDKITDETITRQIHRR
jgi:hypothetical protein